MKPIDARQLAQLMKTRDDLMILDVLPEDAYRERHIPGAVNVPFDSAEFDSAAESAVLSKSQPIVVYCGSEACDLSSRAAERLEELGFTEVMDFTGGIESWTGAGKQTVSV